MEINLQPGKIYKIAHKRKGHFVAHLLEIVPADEGDEEDEVLLKIKYDVRVGTDQRRLAMQPTQKVRVSQIRPSLIIKIEEIEGEDWLREIKVSEEEKPKPIDDGLIRKVSKLFGRRE